MNYYEIKNLITGECFSEYAKSYKEACAKHNCKAYKCKCIYSYKLGENN